MFFLDQNHQVQSELCEKAAQFRLVEDSFHMWWKMKTVVGEREVLGTASRLNFYPADCNGEEAEESGGGELAQEHCLCNSFMVTCLLSIF